MQRQLSLIRNGILLTGSISTITNLLLPYGWDEFGLCDIGPLSTLAFLLTVAYATFRHQLFDLRVVVRRAVIYGLLLAFVLGTYSSALLLVTQHLTSNDGNTGAWVQFVILLIAFSLDPLRRFLDKKVDRLLFGRDNEGTRSEQNSAPNKPTLE